MPNSGGVTGLAANGDVVGGGAANVLAGGAAGNGCVAEGNCTRCAPASTPPMSATTRPAMINAVRFTGYRRAGSDSVEKRAAGAREPVNTNAAARRQLQPSPAAFGGCKSHFARKPGIG